MKIKLYTHNDLDGVGCAVLAKLAFQEEVIINYCNYDEIDDKIMEQLLYRGNKDVIFITDISVSEEVAGEIERISPKSTKLIDHHGTAAWLNKYSWARVVEKEYNEVEKRDQITSGTSLFYEFLQEMGVLQPTDALDDFTETVRRYDSWEWKNVYNDSHPQQLNSLLYLLGRWKFVQRFTKNPDTTFTKSEQLLLEIEERQTQQYINNKRKELIETSLNVEGASYNIGVVFAEQKISDLGNILSEENQHLDFIMIPNLGRNSVSFRGCKDEINLGEIAKHFGGGGHPKAAGAKLEDRKLKKIIEIIKDIA